MRKRISGRFLSGILAAVLMCTSLPETAYATGNIVEDGQEMLEEAFGESVIDQSPEGHTAYAVSGYTPRVSAPNRNNANDYKYYYGANPYAGPNNCTFYAWGRVYELLGVKPRTWTGNACEWWYNKDGYERSSIPRLGAMMCWGTSADNGYGHVAIVEEIHGDGRISFSEARYPDCAFSYQTRRISELSGIYRGTFQGYIYLPGVGEEGSTITPQPVVGSELSGPFVRTIADGDYHIITAVDDDMCLNLGRSGLTACIDHSTEEAGQTFTVQWLGEWQGYKITHRAMGMTLNVYGVEEEQRVGVNYGSSNYLWAIDEVDGGAYYTVRARCSGFYMDVCGGQSTDGTYVQVYRGNESAAQKWRFIPAGVQDIQNGEYYIMSDVAVDRSLDIENVSTENEANVIINPRSIGKNSQIFTVTSLNNGFYRLLNKNSGKSLDIYKGESYRGTNVQQYEYHGGKSQQWAICEAGDGCYYIQPRCSGHYLDVANGGTAGGTNVWTTVWMGGAAAQKWKLVPVRQTVEKPKLDPPTASIPSGTEVEAGEKISLSCGAEGAAVYYTLDGTGPSEQSALYADPITVTQNMTIKAIAVKEGYQESDTAVFSYTVKRHDGGEDTPGEEIPKEDMPDDGVIPDGLWIAGLTEDGYYYTGRAIRPEVRVYDHKTLLKEKTDYTISYKNNTKAYGYGTSDTAFDAGKAPTIIVTGRGNYTGKETQTFKILPQDIGSPAFAADDMTIAYKAKGTQKPIPVLIWKDKKLNNRTDYTVTYYDSSDNKLDSVKEAGVYYVELTGKGNFGGVRRVKLTVTGQLKLMSKMSVAGIKGQPYTGSAITPALTVKDGKTKLTEGEHYTVSYSRNTAVGTAYAIVTGIEAAGYSGTKRISFKITGTPVTKATVTGLSEQKYFYEGTDITPQIRLSLKTKSAEPAKPLIFGTDYTVAWQKNRNAGTATAIITGKGGYTGTLKKNFKIGKFDIAANADDRFTAELEQETVPYVKGSTKPTAVVKFRKSDGSWQTLEEGRDYTLSCRNHTAVNDGSRADKRPTVTVKGKGNFSGTFGAGLTYRIAAQDIGQLTLTAQDRTYQNKNNIYATKVTITDRNGKALKAGTDYHKRFTYTYKNETVVISASNYGTVVRAAGDFVDQDDIIPAGTVLVVRADAKDGGNYTGMVTGEYRITQAAISSASVTIPVQTYTGREVTPDKGQITVEMKGNLVDPSQYEIVAGSYQNNIKKGKASVTIRGVGNYGGTKTVKFSIRAKGFLWWWK